MDFSPAPLDVARVLDTEWLSTALSQNRDPVRVRSFDVIETIGPSALKIRLALQFEEPDSGIPGQICIKGIFDPALSTWLTSGAQRAEAFFYRHAAPQLSVRVPRALYTGYDPETGAGHVIMEDLVPKGVRFLSAMSPYSIEQARQSVDQLARLHGGTWNADPERDDWVTSKLRYFAETQSVPAPRLTELMGGERGEGLSDDIRDGARIYAAIGALGDRDTGLVRGFIHGDAHAGNVWEGPEGIGLIDWQVLQRGNWSLDVAYHLAAVLAVEDRRAHERALLDHYLERLAIHGGSPPPREDAWQLYRGAMPYGLLMWGMTQRVEPEIIRQFVLRLGTAATDHDSFAMLGI